MHKKIKYETALTLMILADNSTPYAKISSSHMHQSNSNLKENPPRKYAYVTNKSLHTCKFLAHKKLTQTPPKF